MAQDIGWSRFNDFDVAFAKAVGIALNAPDERTAHGSFEDLDEDDAALFMHSANPQAHGF